MSADVKSDYVRTVHRRLSRDDRRRLAADCGELEARARRWLAEDAPAVRESALAFTADMRYVGRRSRSRCRSTRPGSGTASLDRLRAAFHDQHERLYAHADRAADVELIDLRATVTGPTPKPELRPLPRPAPGPHPPPAGRSTTAASATRRPSTSAATSAPATRSPGRRSSSRTTPRRSCRRTATARWTRSATSCSSGG